jgi:DNA-binding SARP family transcriptional activator/tetratricopeptide (TPR) repeat protein
MEFRILGPLEARHGEASVSLGPEKQRALLAVLLLHANRTVSIGLLIEELWGDQPPESAAKVIQTHVSRLRKVLPKAMLRTRAPGYVLELDSEQLDLHRFERLCAEGRQALANGDAEGGACALREALSLWRGAALAEFVSEPLSQREAARLEELRLSAVEDRIDGDLALSRHADLVAELESVVAHHPLRERLRAQLMIALYRSGRQAEALAVYQDARRALVDELGIEPGRALQDLERAILRQEPALDPPAGPSSPTSSVRAATAGEAPAPERGQFVGRDVELGRLRAALGDALAGHGRLVLLSGEPGIGKTRIAVELSAEATGHGARVLWGRCSDHEGAPPYWPWLQAIRAYIAACDHDRLRAELGADAAIIAEVVPEVRVALRAVESPAALADEKQARFRLLDSLASFLVRAAANEPLLLTIEDVQVADVGSLALLEFVARGLGRAHLLVVVTYRDVDLARGHPLSQTFAELTRERLFERIPLRGLSESDVAGFIEGSVGLAPPAGLVSMVYGQTEGNPLFVTEVVQLLEQEGKLAPERLTQRRDWSVGVPEGLREVISRRLDRLSDLCNSVLELASVIGREFRLDQLAPLVEASDDELLGVAEEALAARLVEEPPGTAGRYRFTHALFRETLLGRLSTTRRVRLHARIAAALEALYGERADAHASELAYHLGEAEPLLGSERLVHYSRLAGEQAFAAHAYEDAIVHFQRALDTREGGPMDDATAELLVALVRSEFLGRERYDLGEALERMRRAFDYYAGTGQARRAVEIAAHPFPLVYGPTGVPALLARALALAPPSSLDAGRILANAGRFLGTNEGDYRAANDAFESALEIARQHGDAALERHTLVLAARVDWWHLHLVGSVAKSTRALELARAADDQQTELYARAWLVREAAIRGNLAEARIHADVSLELADRLRERYWVATARVNGLWIASLEGDWDEARRQSDAGLSLQPRDARNLGLRALIEYELGEEGEGDAYIERLLDAMRGTAQGSTIEHAEAAAVIALAGRITARHDRFPKAAAAAGIALTAPIRFPIFDVFARLGVAMIAVEQGDAAAAREQYRALQAHAGTLLILVCVAADRALGLLSRTMGDVDAAHAHFEAALTFCQRAGYRPEFARTAFEYAESLRARADPGDAERASELTEAALAIADVLGMRALGRRSGPAKGGVLPPANAVSRAGHAGAPRRAESAPRPGGADRLVMAPEPDPPRATETVRRDS